ncbi:hypothetical protein BpHYR1_038595 [Brachionus plicatilis]|uniref:Uncharacterized protein n=1 Tax=Brachionus plicatilis TaxID=10195 RepID=A0A3M7PNV0_BRAPC|nr:hypothetical protein BpHYR1_038595 [Brachionus plicatilis]
MEWLKSMMITDTLALIIFIKSIKFMLMVKLTKQLRLWGPMVQILLTTIKVISIKLANHLNWLRLNDKFSFYKEI